MNARHIKDPMDAVARRLGTTPGQAWTLTIGLALGASLLATSLPPVLAARGATTVASSPAATDDVGALTGLAPAAPVVPPVPPPALTVLALPPTQALAPLFLPPPTLPALAPTPPRADPSPAPIPAPALSADPIPVAAPAGPLRVRAAGFSTPDAATPALPPDGLPVGAGLGAPREISHLRLAGTGTVLTLAVDTASSVGDAAVRACPHRTADWKAGRPQAVVPFDGADCVPGVRTGDVVSFNLAGFSDRAGPAGFALVVAPTTATVSATFRLVLRPTAPGAMS